MKRLSSVAQYLFLGIGFAIVWGVAVTLIVGAVFPVDGQVRDSLVHDKNGNLYIHGKFGTRNLDGTPTDQTARTDQLTTSHLYANPSVDQAAIDETWQPVVISWRDWQIQELNNSSRKYRNIGDYYHFLYPHQETSPACFIIYDGKTRLIKYYVGKNGISATPPADDECFQVYGKHVDTRNILSSYTDFHNSAKMPEETTSTYIESILERHISTSHTLHTIFIRTTDKRVLRVDLREGTFKSLTDRPAIQMAEGWYPPESGTADNRILVRCEDAIMSFDWSGSQKGEWPIPEFLRKKDLEVAQTTDHGIVLNWYDKDQQALKYIQSSCLISSNGAIEYLRENLTSYDAFPESSRPSPFQSVLAVPIPAITCLMSFAFSATYAAFCEQSTYDAFRRFVLPEFIMTLCSTLAIAGILVVVYIIRQIQNGVRVNPLHIALILTFGLPGFVTLIWTLPRTRKAIFEPAPSRLGTEIFA